MNMSTFKMKRAGLLKFKSLAELQVEGPGFKYRFVWVQTHARLLPQETSVEQSNSLSVLSSGCRGMMQQNGLANQERFQGRIRC